MSRRVFVLICLLFSFMTMAVQASAFPYFLQDDFTYNPFSAYKLVADGRIQSWERKDIIAWFDMKATTELATSTVGDTWQMEFGGGTLKIYFSDPNNPLWLGTFDSMIIYGKNNGVYNVATEGFPRPSYETQPTEYKAMGYLTANKVAGTWKAPQIFIELGFYNIADVIDSEIGVGNMQGRLTIVPEPGTIAALITGMASLGGLAIKKFRR